jgi:CRISPR/Cas system-associated exonuclease Cas4 (RecB family)
MTAQSAVWVSHSSIGDFLACPRLYYFRNVYKDPLTGNKINRIEPPLALGQAVHDVIESLSVLPVRERLTMPPIKRLDAAWEKISGKKGGFKSKAEEDDYKARARAMLERLTANPGPLATKTIKIKSEDSLPPRYLISQEENIILCGKIDWLEYIPEIDSVHIVDFKTGKWVQNEDSLQLPIYYLLAKNLQSRKIDKTSYWYLDREDAPREVSLPVADEAREKVLAIAKRIKLARQLSHFNCPKGGCKYCFPYELITSGKGEKVGESDYQDIYIV